MLLDDAQNWDEALFPIRVVAQGGGFAPNTLRSWIQRKQISMPASLAEANGLPHLFSFRHALSIAVTANLAALGEKPSLAFAAAARWTEEGGDSGAGSQYGLNAPMRDAASLYQEGSWETVLISSTSDHQYQVVPTPVVRGANGVFLPMGFIFEAGGTRMRMVWLNQVHRQMRTVCDAFLRNSARRSFGDMKAELLAKTGDRD